MFRRITACQGTRDKECVKRHWWNWSYIVWLKGGRHDLSKNGFQCPTQGFWGMFIAFHLLLYNFHSIILYLCHTVHRVTMVLLVGWHGGVGTSCPWHQHSWLLGSPILIHAGKGRPAVLHYTQCTVGCGTPSGQREFIPHTLGKVAMAPMGLLGFVPPKEVWYRS